MKIPNRIVIATGIYPPEIGGPAEYARQLFETFVTQKYQVSVVTFQGLKKIVTGVRHFLYFCTLILDGYDADYIIALDTFSVGLPSVFMGFIFGTKVTVRVAGDFLWESYVDRTKEKILLSEFYKTHRNFTIKEKIIFRMTRWLLNRADAVVFSTQWQREIFSQPYGLAQSKCFVIENFYGQFAQSNGESKNSKIFLSPSRDREIKNKANLEKAWSSILVKHPEVLLDTKIVSHEVLEEKIASSYAVIVPSLSEVSPNLLLDALSYGVPAIVTEDTGIKDRVRDMVVFVDPRSVESIAQGIELMLDPAIRKKCEEAISSRKFVHSWNEIAQEFIDVYGKI